MFGLLSVRPGFDSGGLAILSPLVKRFSDLQPRFYPMLRALVIQVHKRKVSSDELFQSDFQLFD